MYKYYVHYRGVTTSVNSHVELTRYRILFKWCNNVQGSISDIKLNPSDYLVFSNIIK